MAYYKLHAYDADVWIPEFRGILQDESLNPDVRYAAEAENVETYEGVLQPHASYDLLSGSFETRIETLAKFHRRWYSGTGSKDWMVCATNGRLYYRQENENAGWFSIPMPDGVSSFACNTWSWVTYEVNVGSDTIDVILMSNAEDGMIMVTPPDRPTIWTDNLSYTWSTLKDETWDTVLSPAWNIQVINTQGYKFGVIERYAERIWGGNVAGEPDLLVYSAPYDPTDWTQDVDNPEDGAGAISQPSWDGDSFKRLKAFGAQLIAFKENRVWRVSGTDPGEYVFTEQFGGGAPYMDTVVVDGERIIMADRDGLSVYDGMTVQPYMRHVFDNVWRTINPDAVDQMCAVLYKNCYYLSIPTGDSEVNNAVLVVNLEENTVLYYTDLQIESFMTLNDTLYATSSSLPGQVLVLGYNSWLSGAAMGSEVKWVSPWIDFGQKAIQKGGFDLYFLGEVQDEAVTFTFSIQTEKKIKTKSYTVNPLNVIASGITWEDSQSEMWSAFVKQRTWGYLAGRTDITSRLFRQKRLHFSGAGRRFRVTVSVAEGVTAPWRLLGGLQLVVETDPD